MNDDAILRRARAAGIAVDWIDASDQPQRVSLVGRNANGRIVQRALISGLTSSNWSQRWQQRPTAS